MRKQNNSHLFCAVPAAIWKNPDEFRNLWRVACGNRGENRANNLEIASAENTKRCACLDGFTKEICQNNSRARETADIPGTTSEPLAIFPDHRFWSYGRVDFQDVFPVTEDANLCLFVWRMVWKRNAAGSVLSGLRNAESCNTISYFSICPSKIQKNRIARNSPRGYGLRGHFCLSDVSALFR